jgi:hypothetical protein
MFFFLFCLFQITQAILVQYDAALLIVGYSRATEAEYAQLITEIKSLFSIRLGIFVSETSTDLQFSRQSLHSKGLVENGRVYLLGYTASAGFTVQNFAVNHLDEISGIILVGSSILPENRDRLTRMPVLTLSGDMDGIFKPMRAAEAYYHASKESWLHPVILLKGHNHAMLLSEGVPLAPIFINYDLHSSIPKSQSIVEAAKMISAFIMIHDETGLLPPAVIQHAKDYLADGLSSSQAVLKPLVDVLELEANPRLRNQCDSDNPSPHCPFYPMYPMVFCFFFK